MSLKMKFSYRLKPRVVMRKTIAETDKALQQAAEYVRTNVVKSGLVPYLTGALLSSLKIEKKKFLTYIVGPSVFYAVYQNFGTRYIKGKHFMEYGLNRLLEKFNKFFERMW